jgi:hypothetical protein
MPGEVGDLERIRVDMRLTQPRTRLVHGVKAQTAYFRSRGSSGSLAVDPGLAGAQPALVHRPPAELPGLRSESEP